MATTVGQHSVSTFATPVNGGPLDANVVRGNDNTIRSAYVAHDADTGIHVQSSTLATRPAAGTAGRKWITADAGSYKLWYDDGTTWHEVGAATIDVFVIADENLVKGDIVKVTGYNTGNGAPRVAKVSSASDVAFGIINGTIANGATGYLTNTGIIADVNTNAFSIGNILYPNTSGGLGIAKPSSGNYQPVAYVLRSNTNNGVLYVEFSAPRIVEATANTGGTVVLRDASGNFAAGIITAGALTSTGQVTFASLKGTGATTVTDILNDGTMATASATTLATSASIKTYVDSQVATVDTLAEVLANGNTTGANNIIVSSGQKLTTNTIDETTAAAGVTIDSVLLKDNEVTATGVRVTNLKANDGTAAGSIANSTGVVTLASSVLTTTDINGGTVDGTTIGASTPAAATFTNITSAGTINLTGATVSNGGSVTTIDINGGTIDGTTIGGASPAAGTFTTINATDINATTFDMTNLEVTNIKAKDGTASMTIADTTGNVTISAALVANGNITLGNATSDTITVGGSFPTGTKLRTDSGVGNTLAVSAYDVDGTAYVDLITATASNTPTLALTSTGVGSMNNIAIGGTTPASGAFTTLDASGDFAVATNKFTVASASGNTAVAGTLTTEGTLTSNGNTVLGNAATDTITATAQFVTGTQLKSAQSANNTLSLSAYDVDGTAYVNLVTLTAGNTPTLTLTSTGTGSMDNITIGGSTAAAGSFTSLSASGNFTLGADVVLSRGAANRLDLASGDSLNVVSGDYQIAGTSVLNSSTLGSGVTASSLTSVGTLTSLTVSGDLTVDTSTLKVDSTNNRVGIGTASPSNDLDISKSVAAGNVIANVVNTSSTGAARLYLGNDSSTSAAYFQVFGSSHAVKPSIINIGGNASYPLVFDTAGTERMRIDTSGNVGIGTATPIFTNATRGNITVNGSDSAILVLTKASNTSAYGYLFYDGTNTTLATSGAALFSTNGSERVRIDTSGNVGIGVTPSNAAVGTYGKNIEIGAVGNTIRANGSSNMVIAANAYFDATDSRWEYAWANLASRYDQADGVHRWFIAPSGTAGNAITFTQAMTLDASGNLGVGTTPSYKLHVATPSSGAGAAFRYTGGTNNPGIFFATTESTSVCDIGTSGSAGNTVLSFSTNATERARITSGGYFKASDDGTYISSTGTYHEFRNTANAIGVAATSTNGSFSSATILARASRAANSAYSFLDAESDTGGDREFQLRGDGNGYADGTWNNNGADYAEYFESATGEALTVGATVVLDGNKVREATEDDAPSIVMGVVRPKAPGKASMVVGNTAWNKWSNKYLTDDFDCYVMEDHEVIEWTGADGKAHSYESHRVPDGVVVPDDAVVKTHDEQGNKFEHYKLNPDYDPSVEYVPREKRDEWVIIGLVGQVKVLKGQPVNDRWVKMRDVSASVEEWMIR